MRVRTVLTAAVATVTVAAGGGVAAVQLTGHAVTGALSTSSTGVAKLEPLPPPAAQLVVPSANTDSEVPWDQPLRIVAEHGVISAVTLTDDRGNVLAGSTTPDGSEYRSANTLVPLDTYRATVTYSDLKGNRHRGIVTVKAADSEKHLLPVMDPGGGATVGVGQPAVIRFNRWVPDGERADVERRLSVTTEPAVQGSWHWVNGQEVHWRPQQYWTPGTQVSFSVDLHRLYLGDGIWGDPVAHSTHFTIGNRHVSKVDVKHHTMQVFDGDKLVQTFKISAGREDKWPTMGGVHIALSKAAEVIMDSATVGIPRNSPDGYYEKVKWDVRISNGGAFVHSAPWSVSEQGTANVSHGCVNLAPSDAEWFYHWSQRGDVIDIFNTPRPPDLQDPGTADWNTSWAAWVAGSALH